MSPALTPTVATPTAAPASTVATAAAAPALIPGVAPVGRVIHLAIDVAGASRTYRLYIPSALPAGPVPLFIALHGGTGRGDQFAQVDHVEGLAESNGFIVVHPDGVKQAGGPGEVWNGGGCCGVAVRQNVDDVGFISALIDQLKGHDAIDPQRVYAYGHSNGAIMSYRLACELSDRIVGIGMWAGTLELPSCTPAQPVSIIHGHGTADQSIPLAGGTGSESLAGVDFAPPHVSFDTLSNADGCPTATTSTAGDIMTERRDSCRAGTAAVFVTIATATHAWPGGTPRVTPAGGVGYAGYDATAQIVAFLLAHPRT